MDSWWEMGLWIPWVWWEAGGELGSLNGSIQGLDGLGETWDSRIVPARGRAWHWMDFSKPSLLGFSELDTTRLGIEALEMCRRCGGPARQTGVYNGKHGKVRSHCSEQERRRLWPPTLSRAWRRTRESPGDRLDSVLDAMEQWERQELSCSIPHLQRRLLDPEPVWNMQPRVCRDSSDLKTPVRAGSTFIRAAINTAK